MFTRRQLIRFSAGLSLAGGVARAPRSKADMAADASAAVDANAGATSASLISPVMADRGDTKVFPLGVASAEPTTQGVVLWTHVPPALHQANSPLQLEMGEDEDFSSVVLTRSLPDSLQAERDGCVTVTVEGGLQSGRYYWYRFRYGDAVSRVGRCRTLCVKPCAERPVRVGIVNCQEYSNGYYAAFRYLANESDIDFVLHLGDSIYERIGGKAYLQRPHADRLIALPSGGDIAVSLEDYRYLYRLYRSDADYQQVLAMHTFVFQLDDHELTNNAYWDAQNHVMGVADHPFGDVNIYPDSIERLRQLQFDALRAWSEYMPSRVHATVSAADPREGVKLYRGMMVGDVSILLMDSRLYRSKQPCKKDLLPLGCTDYLQENLTLLGEQQREWLLAGVADPQPRWTLLASQIGMSRIAVGNSRRPWGVANTDSWDGYASERAAVFHALNAAQRRRFVVFSGDMHATLAGVLQPGELAPDLPHADAVLGAEFMTPAVSSAATVDLLFPRLRQSGFLRRITARMLGKVFAWMNPQLKYINIDEHGYSIAEISADQVRWQAKMVEIDVPAAVASMRVAADFVYSPEEANAPDKNDSPGKNHAPEKAESVLRAVS